MKKWVVPENSNKRVQRASRTIGKGTGTPEDIREARDVLSNYRLAHAFPLNAVTVTVRQRALAVAEVDKLVGVLVDLPRSKNRVKKVYNYLRDDPGPRNSGYRGVHLVYEYGASKRNTTACGSSCRCARCFSTPGRPPSRPWICSRAAS